MFLRMSFTTAADSLRGMAGRLHGEMNEAILSLNWMQGFGFSAPVAGDLSPLQMECLNRIRVWQLPLVILVTWRESQLRRQPLKDLLHGETDYFEPSSAISLAPYNLKLISLPSSLMEAARAMTLSDQWPNNEADKPRGFEPWSHPFSPNGALGPKAAATPAKLSTSETTRHFPGATSQCKLHPTAKQEVNSQLRLQFRDDRSQAADKTEASGAQRSPPPAAVSGRNSGSSVARADSSGEKGRPDQDREVLLGGIPPVQSICAEDPSEPVKCCRNGPRLVPVHDSKVFGRPSRPSRRQTDGCRLPSPCQLWAPWVQIPTSRQPRSQGVEAIGTWPEPQSLPTCSMVSDLRGDGSPAASQDGVVHHLGSGVLCPAIRTIISLQSLLAGSTNSYAHMRSRTGSPLQDERVRRLSLAGHTIPAAMGTNAFERAACPAAAPAAVGLHVLRLFPCLFPSCQEPERGSDPVPPSSLRPLD